MVEPLMLFHRPGGVREISRWVSYSLLSHAICDADGARPTLEKPKI